MKMISLLVLLLLTSCELDAVEIGGVEFTAQRIEAPKGESALAFADVNSDGHQDLVIASLEANDVILFRGDGRGNLTRVGRYPAGDNPTDVVAADINGDGSVDLVVANHETSYITLLIGDGKGGFRPASNSPLVVDVGPHPHAVAVEDLDRDGHVDLIVDDRTGEGLLVIRGLGNGAYDTRGTLVDVGGDPYLGFATGDINRDGRLDLVTPNPNEVAVMLSTDPRGLNFERASLSSAGSPFAVQLADLNHDGLLDLIVASDGSTSDIRVYIQTGQTEFAEARDSPFDMAGGAKDSAVGDVNGDGTADVLVSSWSSDALIVLGGSETFDTVRLRGLKNPWGLAIGDLNEDGKDDFAIADGTDPSVMLYLSQQ